ncbi:hypothetical protein CB1_000216032 [Camelus ferus]|nr:hypothetical protein CB1_000216032 [Camelus ferus]
MSTAHVFSPFQGRECHSPVWVGITRTVCVLNEPKAIYGYQSKFGSTPGHSEGDSHTLTAEKPDLLHGDRGARARHVEGPPPSDRSLELTSCAEGSHAGRHAAWRAETAVRRGAEQT